MQESSGREKKSVRDTIMAANKLVAALKVDFMGCIECGRCFPDNGNRQGRFRQLQMHRYIQGQDIRSGELP